MRWVRDGTGRFRQRPFYEDDEIDDECERAITQLLLDRHERVMYPISTDDLVVLIEQEAKDLDIYADLSGEGPGVEGVTYFTPGARPIVKIARELSEDPRRSNRLRTTLTHEYGHVRFHRFLFGIEAPSLELFKGKDAQPFARCKRETITNPRAVDWLEWQAAYACGALLMPRRALRELVDSLRLTDFPLEPNTAEALGLATIVQQHFSVSADAARVRLGRRGYLRPAFAETLV